ncbi:hypothetical protein EBZ39_11290 [bacterium]|nr:hypothetical protein [bacterium]
MLQEDLSVGEVKVGFGNRVFASVNTAGATGWSLLQNVNAGCTLTPGIWVVRWNIYTNVVSGTSTGQKVAVLTTDNTDFWPPSSNLSQGNLNLGNGTLSGSQSAVNVSIVQVTPAGIVGGTGFTLYGKLYVTTHTSFIGDYSVDIVSTRIA